MLTFTLHAFLILVGLLPVCPIFFYEVTVYVTWLCPLPLFYVVRKGLHVHVCCSCMRYTWIFRSLDIGSCVAGTLCGFSPASPSLCCSSLTKYPRWLHAVCTVHYLVCFCCVSVSVCLVCLMDIIACAFPFLRSTYTSLFVVFVCLISTPDVYHCVAYIMIRCCPHSLSTLFPLCQIVQVLLISSALVVPRYCTKVP